MANSKRRDERNLRRANSLSEPLSRSSQWEVVRGSTLAVTNKYRNVLDIHSRHLRFEQARVGRSGRKILDDQVPHEVEEKFGSA